MVKRIRLRPFIRQRRCFAEPNQRFLCRKNRNCSPNTANPKETIWSDQHRHRRFQTEDHGSHLHDEPSGGQETALRGCDEPFKGPHREALQSVPRRRKTCTATTSPPFQDEESKAHVSYSRSSTVQLQLRVAYRLLQKQHRHKESVRVRQDFTLGNEIPNQHVKNIKFSKIMKNH